MVLNTKERIIAARQISTERYILSTHPALYLPLWKRRAGGLALIRSDDAYGHLCTAVGSVITRTGKVFGGVSDYVRVPSTFAFGGTAISIQAWVYPYTLAPARALIACRGVAGDNWHFYVSAGVEDKVSFAFWVANAAQVATSTYVLPVNKWTLVGVTFDNVTVRFYFNGSLTDSIALAGPMDNDSPTTYVGCYDNFSSFYHGIMGDLLVHPRTLSNVEMRYMEQATSWRY